LTPIARNAADDKAEHNKKLLPPCQTASLPLPPQIPKPPHLRSPTPSEFAKPEPVQQNGTISPNEIKTEMPDDEVEEENGLVVLPSGAAVRLRDATPPPSKRGKRKRSASKSIEVFPGGLAQIQAGLKPRDGKSPPRKISSVLGAGHGYARPHPTSQPDQECNAGQPVQQYSQKPVSKVIVMPDPASPAKRGPGRPPGTASPQITNTPGSPYPITRGRPRLINPGLSPRPGLHDLVDLGPELS